jgi:CRISPR/Cas system CSM-associated protein Csm3 (group 7 of RAMP superfamily)
MKEIREYYEFVPVNSTLRRLRQFDSRLKYENMFIIKPKFRAKTDLHVSSGKKKLVKRENRFEVLLQHYKNAKEVPVIPGSSFKGAVSKNFLALSGDSEITANLFGGATRERAVISKLFFSDLIPESNVKTREVEVLRQWKPRRGKDRGSSANGGYVKFYTGRAPKTERYGLMECIPAGTVLGGKICGYNLRERELELGGLLISMGYGIQNAVFKIGYAKPQGFGQLQLIDVGLSEIEFDGRSFIERKREPDEFAEKFRQKYGNRIKEYAGIVFRGI